MPNVTDDTWKVGGRPVSTIARSFSAALDDAFFIRPELDNLSQSVAQKQQSLSTRKSELEELEARLRETEARLRDQQQSTPASVSSPDPSGPLPNHRNVSSRVWSGLEGAFVPPDNTSSEVIPHNGNSSHTHLRQEDRSPRAQSTVEQRRPSTIARKASSSSSLDAKADPKNQNSYKNPRRY